MTTGLNAATFDNLQLGAGLFLKNFNDAAAQSAAELRLLLAAAIEDGGGVIGATRGGGSFQCTPALRSIEADGLRAPTVGATVNDGWTVKLTGTMLEITPQHFADALACAEVDTREHRTTLRLRNGIAPEDHIPSLCWVGDTSRGFVLISLDNALGMKGAAFTFADKGEGTLPFEFQAHQDSAADQAFAPCRIVFFD